MNTIGKSTVAAATRAYWENERWASNHATEIHARHEGKWIAVADGKVVAAGRNPIRVRQMAALQTGYTTEEVFVEFVDSAGAIYGTDQTVVQDLADTSPSTRRRRRHCRPVDGKGTFPEDRRRRN